MDSIWIFFPVCNPKVVNSQWMLLLVWDAARFSALWAAFWIGAADTMTLAEIIAALMFILFIWCKMNSQYEYHVSVQMNGI